MRELFNGCEIEIKNRFNKGSNKIKVLEFKVVSDALIKFRKLKNAALGEGEKNLDFAIGVFKGTGGDIHVLLSSENIKILSEPKQVFIKEDPYGEDWN